MVKLTLVVVYGGGVGNNGWLWGTRDFLTRGVCVWGCVVEHMG